MPEILVEIKKLINEVGAESRRLLDQNEISGEDHHKILLAMNNLFAYLNAKYGNNEHLSEEVGKMIKSLIDPAVKEEGLKDNIIAAARTGSMKEYMERFKSL